MNYDENEELRKLEEEDLEKHTLFVNLHNLLKSRKSVEDIAEVIMEGTLKGMDIEKKDTLDRFLDFVLFKVKTGIPHIPNLAYPTQKMADPDLEKIIIELLNYQLMPDIIFRVLKSLTRNVQNSDTNLYLAHLIHSEELIKPIFETFKMFRSDIEQEEPDKRTRNVKSIQQYSSHTDERYSSPLDAACRLKYVLEYILLNNKGIRLYSHTDLMLSKKS